MVKIHRRQTFVLANVLASSLVAEVGSASSFGAKNLVPRVDVQNSRTSPSHNLNKPQNQRQPPVTTKLAYPKCFFVLDLLLPSVTRSSQEATKQRQCRPPWFSVLERHTVDATVRPRSAGSDPSTFQVQRSFPKACHVKFPFRLRWCPLVVLLSNTTTTTTQPEMSQNFQKLLNSKCSSLLPSCLL